jgi:ubiquinone biosynthesis UbiH/UbiF/VisC/COQ6 family hydroxylase
MTQSFDICVRGAGIVGQTLALLLAREKFRVALVGSSGPAVPSQQDVRAYALNAASHQLLLDLRAWPEGSAVTPMARMKVHGGQSHSGNPATQNPLGHLTFSASEINQSALAWMVKVPALEQQLSEAIRYQPGITRLEGEPAGAHSHHEPIHATLTVITEGRQSATRAELGVPFNSRPYPQTALAARLHASRPHQQTAHQWFFENQILALLPTGGPEGDTYALVLSAPHAPAAVLQTLGAEAFSAHLNQLLEKWAPGSGNPGGLSLTSDVMGWPLYFSQAVRWCGAALETQSPSSAWVLAGDAAHTVHPLAGQGLNLGLADAAALTRRLRDRPYWRSLADLKGLRAYERERKAGIWPMSWTTDGLQLLFELSPAPLQTARNWGLSAFDRSGPLKQWATKIAMGLT